MVKVRFYTLTEKFGVVRSEDFDSMGNAKSAVNDYLRETGYINLRFVDDEDFTIRCTATTPNGRAGRNVASIEQGWEK